MQTEPNSAQPNGGANKLYFAAWRWHFFAGLFVIPFLMTHAITGMMMLWISWIDGRDGERTQVAPQITPAAISALAEAATAAVPEGVLKQYVAPRREDLAALFRVDSNGDATMVAVDPYTAKVIETFPRRSGWYDFFDNIHSDLKLGTVGDRILETAASISLVLIATGIFMWWPRGTSLRSVLVPSLTRGRALWKSLHGAVGIWISLVLFFFLVSGLSWAGIWGGKIVQAWSQFPAEKWENIPLSDETHASMNHERREVPWALEKTPMPASGGSSGLVGILGPVTMDSVDRFAREIGFDARYQLNLPQGENGVWTLSRDSMSTDSNSPTTDRTVHIDQYTGKILVDVRYEDYSLAGKAMAVGIALHMGTLGLWSVLANTIFCLCVLFMCVTSIVLWVKRRPVNARRLAAPPMPSELHVWQGAVTVGLALSLAFPMAGVAILTVLLFDAFVLTYLPRVRRCLT
ncbi:PepSY-associated TM helix domain-containing protein [Ruegeria arenilitoris]|uniref:PepSY-associated TM helix domain-containing protein n=1 Tax=Ruegeria arenilitoris TaxID=1173585 RepID=UPI00147EAA7D|nr:PepSY domain-containing protein [Ruegeria arenilitoris]